MSTDALNRRLRHAKPQPRARSIALGPRDYVIFQALQRHGPLPSLYLFALTKHLGGNFTAFQHRLTKLYNGSASRAPLLVRPPQQFASFRARYQSLIYDLTPLAVRLLAERGMLERTANRTDHFLHRFMGACVSASIELACRERGHRYIALEEILAHANIERANPLSIPLGGGKALIPDNLFGIQYNKGSYRFFAVEIDRNTESIERMRLDQSAFGRKVHGYLHLLSTSAYKAHWGIPNLIVLTVTTNQTHLQNLVRYVVTLDSKADHFLFKAEPAFGANWYVPELLCDRLAEAWEGVVRLSILET